MPGCVAVGRPEARGVGRQHLVGEDDLGAGVAAELELGVGEDDPALGRVLGAARVDLDRDPPQLLHQRPVADDLGGAVEVDVLVVVADLGLGRRGEDRLRQLVGLEQVGRQLDPADRAAVLVFLPARAGEVAAHDALDRVHLQPPHPHRPFRRPLPARRPRGSGWGRCRRSARTRIPRSGSAPCPCRGSASASPRRRSRSGRRRPSAGRPPTRRSRGPCLRNGASGRRRVALSAMLTTRRSGAPVRLPASAILSA